MNRYEETTRLVHKLGPRGVTIRGSYVSKKYVMVLCVGGHCERHQLLLQAALLIYGPRSM